MRGNLLAVRFGIAATLFAACGDDGAPQAPREERQLFVEKVHRALHPGAPPLDEARLASLLDRSDEQIVAELYADPRTGDTVFELSLAFLGAPIDRVREAGVWSRAPFAFPPAVNATQAFRAGDDPLAPLLSVYSTPSLGPLEEPDSSGFEFNYPEAIPLPGATRLDRARAAMQYIWDDLAELRAYVTALPEPITLDALCTDYLLSPLFSLALEIPRYYGLPSNLIDSGTVPELNYEVDVYPLDYICYNADTFPDLPPPETAIPPREDLLAHVDRTEALFRAAVVTLEALVARLEADPDAPFAPIDLETYGLVPYYYFDVPDGPALYTTPHFYNAFWDNAPNSSTNYNRRRGAYVLERYFCDDLKPVGAALPESHGDGAHAADPACAACHFKLDPMAGFFRRYGSFGTLYDEATLADNDGNLFFDDGAQANFAAYEQAWRAPTGSGHEFDVGFIRSTRDASANSYGSTLDDLDTLLREAPEVQRCVAQRMFEYFAGEDQAVDPAFLDQLSAAMTAAGPAKRFERGIIGVLTSQTFRASERNTHACYDVAGGDAVDRPPCEVASIVKSSCTSCHNASNPQAGLDLSRWTRLADGGFGFPHGSVARAETFARMLDRVKTSDLARQMPQSQDMPLRQREQLALWLQAMLEP